MTAFNRAVEGLKQVEGLAMKSPRQRAAIVRKVLEAVREPDGAQQADGRDAIIPYVGLGLSRPVDDQWQIAREVWTAMIDAIIIQDRTDDPLKWAQQDATPNTHRAVGAHYWQIMGEAAEREFNAGRPSDKKD